MDERASVRSRVSSVSAGPSVLLGPTLAIRIVAAVRVPRKAVDSFEPMTSIVICIQRNALPTLIGGGGRLLPGRLLPVLPNEYRVSHNKFPRMGKQTVWTSVFTNRCWCFTCVWGLMAHPVLLGDQFSLRKVLAYSRTSLFF